ncbi:MAG: carboxypeptidase regulatory-like domain-containing protein [Xanthobacteraceae bacterium]
MKTTSVLGLSAALSISLAQFGLSAAFADDRAPAALTGQVTSDVEGAMDGVVVTAHKDGSIVSVSVTTDARGRYAFPDNKLVPGEYKITIRAVGYEISVPTTADVVAEKTVTADIKLKKTRNLASQLSNAEWMMSIPGTEEQKAMLLDCTGCHTLERIVRSTHDADEWTQVITRMKGYAFVSTPLKPQRMLDETRAGKPEDYRKMAEYLATINLSAVDKWDYPLKTLPRPSGRATRAIVTEYDMKRATTQPHDVLLDKDGDVWYSDFGELFISKFDPKTLKLTEYPTKEFKLGAPVGNLSLEFDNEGKLWFDTMHQGAIGTIDPKTSEIKYYPLPPEWNDNRVQLNFVGLRHDVDGKVWTKSVGTVDVFRLDLASGKWERFHPTDFLPPGHRYSIYQLISDSKNNVWMAEFEEGYLGRIDAKTLKVTWFPLPSPHGRARRMEIDDQDRILVTEYRANKVALFDTKTEQFTEYDLPPLTFPYRAQIDQNGELWTGGMSTDRVVRVDPKTDTVVEYLMPSGTNMRTVYVDNSTTPVTFWVGSNHAHALVKVEPQD